MAEDNIPWLPLNLTKQMQEASEDAVEKQTKMLEAWQNTLSPTAMMGAATFKTRVQSGGRISIPDAERDALDIDEGDIVQAIILPIKRGKKEEE